MLNKVIKCDNEELCPSCQIEILEAINSDLKDEVASGDAYITELENKVYNLEEDIQLLEEKINTFKDDDVDEDFTINIKYDDIVNLYYHEDFSIQEIFKRIGKKAVEVEFQKFLMTQDE